MNQKPDVEIRISKHPGREDRSYDIDGVEKVFFGGRPSSTPGVSKTDGAHTGILPDRQRVTIRRGDNPPGEQRQPAFKFTIGGQLLKKDGSPGKRSATFYFNPTNAELAPTWAQEVLREQVTTDDNDWHGIGSARIRRTKTQISDLFVVTNAAPMRDARDWTWVLPHRINVTVSSSGYVQVAVEGAKLKSDGTAGVLKGHAIPDPASYPPWLQQLVAQQRDLIKLDAAP